MPRRASPFADPDRDDFASLFDFLPIGAYRSLPDGSLLRANPALVRLCGYASEAELLAAVREIGREWYVEPGRHNQLHEHLERDGEVRSFVSEVYRHRTRERIWISENAQAITDADGSVLYHEGTVEEVTGRVEAEGALQRSEQQLREIAARLPGVVYRLHVAPDGRHRFTYVSDGLRGLFGIEPEALLADGDLLRHHTHPDDVPMLSAEIEASARSGRPAHAEFRIVLADGDVKWVQLASSPVPADEPGDARVGMLVEITARKQAEIALREHDARWKLALESAGDGVWDCDFANRHEVVSPRLLQMYGLSPADHDGGLGALDRLVHPDDRTALQHDRDRHLQGLTPAYVNEHRMRCHDGSLKWILSRGLVIERDGHGQALRMIGTHTDISERKEAETLRRERDRAAAAHKTQSAFLSRVSHELRTPLNAIIGFAQLLDVEKVGTPRQQGWVRTIVDSGRHLLSLVNDLLDLSSAPGGQPPLAREAVDLALLLREAWALQAAGAEEAGIAFFDRLPDSGECLVQADPARLKQVLGHLLSNAVKYNRAGGRVEAEVARAGETVELSIGDSGQGMDAVQLARLFSPFWRGGPQHLAASGTGLGLALAKRLVEAMGGTIAARSALGQGSRFTVRLPRLAGGAGTGR